MNVFVNGEIRTVQINCTVLEVVEIICGSPVPTGVAVVFDGYSTATMEYDFDEEDDVLKYSGHQWRINTSTQYMQCGS